MLKASDICASVGPLPVSYGDLNNLQILFHRAEYQIEISKGIKISEIAPVSPDLHIIPPEKGLCAAKRVLEPLVQKPGEHHGKKFVTKVI